MRPGVDPHTAPNKPPLPPEGHRLERLGDIIVDRNLPITLRDGVVIFGDVYRPAGRAGEKDLPTLLSWSPYGKHAQSNQVFWPASGVNPAWLSQLTPFEGPDPVYWCAAGYAVAVIDPRGAWRSGGDFHHNGQIEGEDCYDTIEFLADQSWSNGSVGMTGVSYLACIQYLVAPFNPPSLKALNPWEGFSDWYREFALHGGIPETGFLPRASDNIQYGPNQTEDTWANVQAHPLYDTYWESKEIPLEEITQPAFFVASWSDQGLHTRGTLEAYRRCSSRQKWLEVHGQKKWANYYSSESRAKRRAFFDHFLKTPGSNVSAWPKVRYEARNNAGDATIRMANDWPLPNANYRKLFLSQGEALKLSAAGYADEAAYDSASGRAIFDYQFEKDTELTGSMSLKLWVEAPDADDMDLFVALEKIMPNGEKTGFAFYAFFENGPVALGWLRASHRALDASRSMPGRPFHSHTHEEKLPSETPVPVEIEIWPSSTIFAKDERLRVIIQGRDIYQEGLPKLPFARHEKTVNAGMHVIHFGGVFDSHLYAPFVE